MATEKAPLIFAKMAAVMRDIGAIGKAQTNAQQGFKFRGIDDLLNALYPVLVKHGVFMTTTTVSANKELKEVVRSSGKTGVDKHINIVMQYSFWAEDGSSVTSMIPAEGVDSGDKATNKALSAALKYALIQTFSIPTLDMEEADRTTIELGSTAKETTVAESTATAAAATEEAAPKRARFARKGAALNGRATATASESATDESF
jgi:hypothetical protein